MYYLTTTVASSFRSCFLNGATQIAWFETVKIRVSILARHKIKNSTNYIAVAGCIDINADHGLSLTFVLDLQASTFTPKRELVSLAFHRYRATGIQTKSSIDTRNAFPPV